MIISTANRLQSLKEYYFSVKLTEIRKMQAEGKPVINLGIGSPDLAPSQATIDELVVAANNPSNHAYQPYKGIATLRKAMADFYSKVYHVSLDAETEILPLIGSKEGITHISLAFLNPDDEVLVPELGYPAYSAVSEMIGAKVRYYPLLEHQNWQPDFKTLYQMDLSKVKLMWLNYPHMPTGAKAEIHTFEKLVAFAKEKKILLCHDNPYSLVLNEEPPISLLAVQGAKEVALELNSMSKTHNMAGWRIGWVSAAKPYIDAILTIKSNVDSGTFLPMQMAATKAFENPIEWHETRNQIYKKRREIVYQLLDTLQCRYTNTQVGMFVWAKIPENLKDAGELVDKMLYEKNIFITPGFIFGEKGSRYVRVSLCTKEETLKEALSRVAQ
ncbi:MAG: aminotransferase class I/II-fold pyridoxal phosphate-dependent enzyme [Thermoflexibacter sp.]|nr:aminotransferase class I/II-fold pyridoxal phosphate-dependent enzyme [Thermoflexibacter sp.]